MIAMLQKLSDALLELIAPRAVAHAACGANACGCWRDPVDGEQVCWIRGVPGGACYPTGWPCYY